MTDHDRNEGASGSDASTPKLALYRCERSHAFFFSHHACPRCRRELEHFEDSPHGTIVSYTTVRVSPTGSPFTLGLVRVACGAQTLCIVDSEAGAEPSREVVVVVRDGLYHAIPLLG